MLGIYFKSIRLRFMDFHLSETFRDRAAQEDAFRSGKSKKKWPNSKHNVIVNGKPESRAFDFFQQEDGKTKYPPKWVLDVVTYCKDHKFNCRYGIDFQDLDDSIHIELLDTIK